MTTNDALFVVGFLSVLLAAITVFLGVVVRAQDKLIDRLIDETWELRSRP
jgi:hypothetical protein